MASPNKNGKKDEERGSQSRDRIEAEDQSGQEEEAENLHPVYDWEGVAGPSRRQSLPAACARDDELDSEEEDRLPTIQENEILRTSGSFPREDGWRLYLTELENAIEESEKESPASPILDSLPETIIQDLGEAKQQLTLMQKLVKSQKKKLEGYKDLNQQLKNRLGRKDVKINKLQASLSDCVRHRTDLELENTRMKQWLQVNHPNWEVDMNPGTPPSSPPHLQRPGTPARGQGRADRPISPNGNASAGAVLDSPERPRTQDPADPASTSVVITPDDGTTPTRTSPSPRKRRASESEDSGSKRARSSSPPPSNSVGAATSPVLPTPVIAVGAQDGDVPGDDSDGENSTTSEESGSGGGDSSSSTSSNNSVFMPPAPPRRRRRILGPRAGSFIPPAPAHAQEEQRLWNRGPGYVTSLRPRVPLNLNVNAWFTHHVGRL